MQQVFPWGHLLILGLSKKLRIQALPRWRVTARRQKPAEPGCLTTLEKQNTAEGGLNTKQLPPQDIYQIIGPEAIRS